MIVPPGMAGVAFTEAADGDVRNDSSAHGGVSQRLGISPQWATLRQVHGAEVRHADSPGAQGEADAVWTACDRLPVAVYTADCFGVVLIADAAVGVAHAGWRGARANVVGALRRAMTAAGHAPLRSALGPGIGSCCFEVGEEVAELFPAHLSTTTWGTTSVDLPSVIIGQLEGLDVVVVEGCTAHEERLFSHRRDGLRRRMAAVGWLE